MSFGSLPPEWSSSLLSAKLSAHIIAIGGNGEIRDAGGQFSRYGRSQINRATAYPIGKAGGNYASPCHGAFLPTLNSLFFNRLLNCVAYGNSGKFRLALVKLCAYMAHELKRRRSAVIPGSPPP